MAKKKIETRTGPSTVFNLHDSQVLTVPGIKRSNAAPWRDGGSNQEFAPWQAATLLLLNDDSTLRPFLATGYTVNAGRDVFTFKIREDAVYQDGTPITAAQLKANWEYGGMPENIVGWGGSMRMGLREVKGMQDLMAGDTTVAFGLVAIDTHTLEVTMNASSPTFPLVTTIDQLGFVKLAQVKADPDNFHFAKPVIGVGPFVMEIDRNSGDTEVTRVGLKGMVWWGEEPIIDKIIYPAISDKQVEIIMFENGEVDIVGRIVGPLLSAALDPNNALHPFLKRTPRGGLYFYSLSTGLAPLDDLFVRKALAHGVDMSTIIKAVLGAQDDATPGPITKFLACNDPDFAGATYDPGLARQFLTESTYGSADNLPVLRVDLYAATRVTIAVATKEYWKDNLGIELDILKREAGMPRRPGSQIFRQSLGAAVTDPAQIITGVRAVIGDVPGREVQDALTTYALSLPLDDPGRCSAFQAVERDMILSGYIIPHEGLNIHSALVKPWVKGWVKKFSQEWPLDEMYVEKH